MAVRGRKARKRLSPEQRREEILAAAQRVFVAHDPSAVTFEEIAAEAGVSRALVYNYFGDKGSLLAEVYRHAVAELDVELCAALRKDQPIEVRLREVVAHYVGFARSRTGTWQLLGHVAAIQHPAVRAAHRERVESLASAFGDGAAVRLAMAGLLGQFEGVTRQWFDEAEPAVPDLLDALEHQAWSGLAGVMAGRVSELAR